MEKKIVKETQKLKQELWHLGNQIFHCGKDAIEALEALRNDYKGFDAPQRPLEFANRLLN